MELQVMPVLVEMEEREQLDLTQLMEPAEMEEMVGEEVQLQQWLQQQ
jgi:hypothetical protein